ncbi:desmoplakin-B-like isoform X2 [Osmerus mordax]|uniref:desmoplakin-B-like isoform X2 n=1 Tax=Osmerus mordax TaxID=8014 RepID=UPI00350FFD20
MSQYGSQRALNTHRRAGSRQDLSAGIPTHYARSEVVHSGNGYGQEYMDGYNTYAFSKGSMGGGQGQSPHSALHQKAYLLQSQCQEYLRKAEHCLQSGGTAEGERYLAMARETVEQLKGCAVDLRQMGQPNDSVIMSVDMCMDQLKSVHMAFNGTMQRRSRGSRGSAGGWEEPGRNYQEAVAWIKQQKRLIETSTWGDDPAAIEQQLVSHARFHSSIQRSAEVERAKDELAAKGDKANLHSLEQEWDSLQKMSFGRTDRLRDLQGIIEEISQEIMWVNEREEEELVFDWGDRNIEAYIPQKQEGYSKLMSNLELKEKDLNKLKLKVDNLLKDGHPASDKIEAYMDTLQTQWSWLLQIIKCIDVHLKENAAYSQFFREANDTYSKLQKEHETIRLNFACDKNTPLDNLQELLQNLEREKGRIMENKRQVQHLVSKSKSIVRLKPRNPDNKTTGTVIVSALCDFKQDQRVICKGNEAILKDNSQRSKWQVTGPGGMDMMVPSVCLLVPPPNPLSINLATKNEQYYEAILTMWNQFYINIKSLISWQYCVQDITHINSLTLTMLARMRPEEYRSIVKSLESHYDEFKVCCHGSQMFGDEDKRSIESQYTGAQAHYDQLVVQLPAYSEWECAQVQQQQVQQQQVQQQQATRVEETKKVVVKKEEVKKVKKKVVASQSLTELHALRVRLDGAEAGLTQHIHVCLGEDGAHDCGLRITRLEAVQRDIESSRVEYLRLKERIQKELEDMSDADKAQFLRSELSLVNQRLGTLEGWSAAYLQRLRALRALLESVARCEDIVKVHEARLTEKETTSLDPAEVEDYMSTLKSMRAELEQKKDVLVSMETELGKAVHWNDQVGGSFHRCDVDLSRYGEQVSQLSDRWRRIQNQIDSRLRGQTVYLQQLQHYRGTGSTLGEWIGATRKQQDGLHGAKIDDIGGLNEHLSQQKALNTEIKGRRENVESVLRDNETCVNSIKDYELELASYSAGLETVLNIPIKRTMLLSPANELTQEATQLQTRYIELFTLSSDNYRYLGGLLNSMEELKMRNTRIDLLEEELRLLKGNVADGDEKNRSLEEAIARYRLELAQSQEHLISVEEVKRHTTLQCNTTKDSLASTQSQLQDLNEQVARLTYSIEEEKRKRTLAEERYGEQRQEYEAMLRKRQKELEEVSWAKMEVEKSVGDREREAERLRRQLAEEASRIKELELELSKVRSLCCAEIANIKQTYESQIHISHTDIQRLTTQREEDGAGLRLQCDMLEAERRDLEEELRRLRLSLSQAEEQRRRADEEAFSQKAAGSEEARRRRELEEQVETLLRQRAEESSQHGQELAQVTKVLQDKNGQLAHLTHILEEESRRRTVLEEERVVMDKTLIKVQAQQSSSTVMVARLGEVELELNRLRPQLEKEASERSRLEQSLTRLQARVRELQATRDGLELELEALKKTNLDDVTKRKRVELELEKTTMTMREYTGTINTLRQSQEDATAGGRRGEEEQRRLKEELERSVREHKASTERLAQLSGQLKALQQQLLQEQSRVRDSNHRYESLHKTLEEKTTALNESSAALEKLRGLTETLTKERLRLEEELRGVRQEKEELVRARRGADDDLASQITALELQLQSSARSSREYQNLVSELSSEREKLRLEIELIQKQSIETSSKIQSTQVQYSDVVKERDALLLKLNATDQDKAHRLEEELNRIKLSLESEVRLKRRFQEESEQVKKDFLYWKDLAGTKEGQVKQFVSERDRLERDRASMKSEMERLMRELREVEETYKRKLVSTQTELSSLTSVRDSLEVELRKLRERPDTLPKHTQTEKTLLDPSTLVFDGVRKPVTAQQLLDCGVLDVPIFNQLIKGQKTVPEVSVDIKLNLKGTGAIAGVASGPQGKMSLTEARKAKLLSPESTVLLLEAQAATGHIIDPRANRKLTVDEAYANGVVDEEHRGRLLVAEAAAVGYRDPNTSKILSASQAMRKGLIDRDTALRFVQAQESMGGILDPVLSVFLPKDVAMDRDLINEDLYRALNQTPECYLDPDTQLGASYVSLKRKCKVDPGTGLLLLPAPEKPMTVQGLRDQVAVSDLVDANLLERTDIDQLREGKLTSQDIETRLRTYLRGSTCIAGVYDEASGKTMPIYQAMKEGLLRPGTTMELLEAQAASGFMIDPVNNLYLTVSEAYTKGLHGPEFKDKLLSAERAVTGYQDPGTDKIISLFQALERGLIEKGHGIRLLEAQIASGGIIDPKHSHRIDVDVAYKKGYFGKEMSQILTDEGDDTKGFFDPNTEENLTYLQLKKRCITDEKTGLILLPIIDKKKQQSTQKNTLRKRRVVIVDPDTNKEMTVKEAYNKGLIDYETFLELSGQECEWEEIVVTNPDGSSSLALIDRQTGTKFDVTDLLKNGVISQSVFEQYRAHTITLTQFADIITSRIKASSSSSTSSSATAATTAAATAASAAATAASAEKATAKSFSSLSSSTMSSQRTTTTSSVISERSTVVDGSAAWATASDPQNYLKHIASVSITLADPAEVFSEQSPVGAIFDTETLEKISITQALKRGLMDSITAQRLLEAQACTGGIVNPATGRRMGIQEASHQGIIEADMATKLKAAQKAYIGFEDVKSKRKMSAAEAMKEKWLPYEAGHRFLEFQYVTGGLYDPELGRRRTIEEALQMGWLDARAAQKLQETRHHAKNLTCPKSKLKISFKEAMDNSLLEENTGVRMLQASTISSRGISSPYNVSSAPGSASGSRSGSRRGSVDLGSSYSYSSYSHTSVSKM